MGATASARARLEWRMHTPPDADPLSTTAEIRLRGADRRRNTLHALWTGNFQTRRRGARRHDDHRLTSTDWHHPQWLAVALLILLACCADAFLTLALINQGATEVNPFMRPLVLGDGRAFALWKLGLTASGVTTLILLARSRFLGRWLVGPILYAVLLGYAVLIGYELWLLAQLPGEVWPVAQMALPG